MIRDPGEFAAFVDFLRPKVRLVRAHPGQVIVRQGELANHFYMVRSGFIKVSESRQGLERVMNYIGPGGYFGEIGLLGKVIESLGDPEYRVPPARSRRGARIPRRRRRARGHLQRLGPRRPGARRRGRLSGDARSISAGPRPPGQRRPAEPARRTSRSGPSWSRCRWASFSTRG